MIRWKLRWRVRWRARWGIEWRVGSRVHHDVGLFDFVGMDERIE